MSMFVDLIVSNILGRNVPVSLDGEWKGGCQCSGSQELAGEAS